MTDRMSDHHNTLTAVPPSFTPAELDGLVLMMDTVAQSWVDGDIAGVLTLLSPSADFTLMPPDGGPSVPRPDDLAAYAEATSKSFAGGEAVFELEQYYASGDLAVLVGIERQHGVVAGLPDQNWSLRLTLVFRRVGDGWEQVHRHADPLVGKIPLEHCAALARGLGS